MEYRELTNGASVVASAKLAQLEPAQPFFHDASLRMRELRDRLSKLAQRIEGVHEEITGSSVSGPDTAEAKRPSSGMAECVLYAARDCRELSDRIERGFAQLANRLI